MNELSDSDIMKYIRNNPLMVVGTIGEGTVPHGAPVYTCALKANEWYFVTKADTHKYRDLQHCNKVSMTITNLAENSCLQATGHAHVVEDPLVIETVMQHMTKIYAHSSEWLPPIAKIRAGPYEVIGIKVLHARLAHYGGAHAGSEDIFKGR